MARRHEWTDEELRYMAEMEQERLRRQRLGDVVYWFGIILGPITFVALLLIGLLR